MVSFRKWLVLLVTMMVLSAVADEGQAVLKGEVRYDGNFYFYPSTPNTLYLIGGIGDFDTFEQYSRASVEFRRAIRNHSVKKLVLASGGGAVDIGLNYAAIINDKELSVYVPESVGCFSACSFMFFGGGEKVAAGPVGVHQFYSSSDQLEKKQKAQQSTQYGVADIIAILNSFQVPPRIYEHMFSRVGNDFYNLTELDLDELGVSQSEEWHKDADGVIDALMTVNSELQSLVAFVKGEDAPKSVVQQDAVAAQPAQPAQPSREEIIRLAFMEVQRLLNEHNCGAGTPDGIVGPRTEKAFERFVTASGARINFDAEDAFEQVITALENTAKPACGIVKADPKRKPDTQPSFSIESAEIGVSGKWATLMRCTENGRPTKYSGFMTFSNRRLQGALILFDVTFSPDQRNFLDGTLRHFPKSDRLEFSMSLKGRSGNSRYKRFSGISNVSAPRKGDDKFKVSPHQFDRELRNNDCTLNAYKVVENSGYVPKAVSRNISIRIVIKNDSWVKIRDADNSTFSSLVKRGEIVKVEGVKPVNVVLGNAQGIGSFEVDGNQLDITPYVTNNVARFNLGK